MGEMRDKFIRGLTGDDQNRQGLLEAFKEECANDISEVLKNLTNAATFLNAIIDSVKEENPQGSDVRSAAVMLGFLEILGRIEARRMIFDMIENNQIPKPEQW